MLAPSRAAGAEQGTTIAVMRVAALAFFFVAVTGFGSLPEEHHEEHDHEEEEHDLSEHAEPSPYGENEIDWLCGFYGNCPEITLNVGDTLTFKWDSSDWDIPHDLWITDDQSIYDSCDIDALKATGTELHPSVMVGEYTVTAPTGTPVWYFICSVRTLGHGAPIGSTHPLPACLPR